MAKVMVSLPDELLVRVDHEAKRRGTSRSALLQAGALRELGNRSPESIDAAVQRARAVLASPGSPDSTDLFRADRDERDRRDRFSR